MSNYLKEDELCKILNVSRVSLWKYRKCGLPFIRIGEKMIRYDLQAVLKWLESSNNEVA